MNALCILLSSPHQKIRGITFFHDHKGQTIKERVVTADKT